MQHDFLSLLIFTPANTLANGDVSCPVCFVFSLILRASHAKVNIIAGSSFILIEYFGLVELICILRRVKEHIHWEGKLTVRET